MTRDRRPSVLRRVLDERTFGHTPTPFGIDRMLLTFPPLAAVGWAVGWLTAKFDGGAQPIEVGWLVAAALVVTYSLAVAFGTLAYRLYDWRSRAARMRESRGPFEQHWAVARTAAFHALGQTQHHERPARELDDALWQLVDDRPRAVIMEAFSRLERLYSAKANPPSTAANRAFTSLRDLRQLAVLHEFPIPPQKAREFLHLCDVATEALTNPRD